MSGFGSVSDIFIYLWLHTECMLFETEYAHRSQKYSLERQADMKEELVDVGLGEFSINL